MNDIIMQEFIPSDEFLETELNQKLAAHMRAWIFSFSEEIMLFKLHTAMAFLG
jgi:hypothetical protein